VSKSMQPVEMGSSESGFGRRRMEGPCSLSRTNIWHFVS